MHPARLLPTLLGVLVAAALVVPAQTRAHDGGRAVPVATVTVRESGPLQALIDVRVRDEDGGEPVRGATVQGFGLMTRPHTMTTYFDPLPEVAPGQYRGQVRLPMIARWTLELEISGQSVVTREVTATVLIDRSALTSAAPGKVRPAPAPAPVVGGTVKFAITARDLTNLVLLWVHGLAAMAWIIGLGLLLVAATAGWGSLLPAARQRLARSFRHQWLPLVWTAAVVVVATGVYNTLRVTPFDLAWTPAGFGRLSRVPYGRLYESILLVKLALFAVMLVAGLVLTLRSRARWDGSAILAVDRRARSLGLHRLGVEGVVFIASAPVIVGLAVALRYVHILSHVAEAAGG